VLVALSQYHSLTTDLRIQIIYKAPEEETSAQRSSQDSFIRQLAIVTNSFDHLKSFVVCFKVQTNIKESWPQVKSAAHFYGHNFKAWELWVCYMKEETLVDGEPVWKQCSAGGKLDRSLTGWRKALAKRNNQSR
jgi:hypothetical protein